MNLIKYRNYFFALSLLIIIPGIFAFFSWGLKVGIDFAGGTLWEIKSQDAQKQLNAQEVKDFLSTIPTEVSQSSQAGTSSVLLRIKETDEAKIKDIKQKMNVKFGATEDVRLETVGPTISRELTQKAFLAVGVSILAIVIFITWSFRKIPKPTSSVAFGFCTIFALVHDVIVVVGIFAILGHFLNIEIDSLFITALLTVIGFSVHDTIVVFDRIRENLIRHSEFPFEEVVNHSLLQTIGRSLNTSLTAVFVLIALFLFGGQSIKTFVLALLVGIISGTYSSIFNAAPLLVVWQKFMSKRKNV
jgi:preprotein translocase subunit SecF